MLADAICDQPEPSQTVDRIGHRLARYAELPGNVVLQQQIAGPTVDAYDRLQQSFEHELGAAAARRSIDRDVIVIFVCSHFSALCLGVDGHRLSTNIGTIKLIFAYFLKSADMQFIIILFLLYIIF